MNSCLLRANCKVVKAFEKLKLTVWIIPNHSIKKIVIVMRITQLSPRLIANSDISF